MKCFFLRLGEEKMVISSIPQIEIDSETTDKVDLGIYSSGLLEWEDEQALMLSLKSDARMAVSHWIQERRYVVRLIVSAIIFVLAYFVFSLAVRDPIPMIDELLIGLALAAVYWVYAKGKDEKAHVAIVKREAIYRAIEETDVTYADMLETIEERYNAYREYDVLTITDMIAEGRIFKLDIDPDDADLFREFKEVFLEQMKKEERALYRDMMKYFKGHRGEKFRHSLIHSHSTTSYDIYLLALALAVYA